MRERNKEINEREGKERKKGKGYGNMEEGSKAKKTDYYMDHGSQVGVQTFIWI